VTSAGVAVTGTLSATGAVTLTTALPVLQGGTGVTTSTGTGAGVHSVGPSISSAVMTTMASSVITSGTTVASTSGTSIDFTSIPSWVKRITVNLSGVSTNGTAVVIVQLGTSGGVVTSGYLGYGVNLTSGVTVGGSLQTTGFAPSRNDSATDTRHGSIVISSMNSNLWAAFGVIALSDATSGGIGAGSISLGGTLDRVRITTVGGTNTFDAGSVNILYD
jgi:hypothetical protein